MVPPQTSRPPRVTRRRALGAAAGAALAGTSGCLKEMRNILSRDGPDRVTLDIKTLPADSDPFAVHIAGHLADNLKAAGVGARVTPMPLEELFRQVLLNHSFDLYVARFPAMELFDPNSLYPLLHSTFAVESGWQNPYGYTNLTADEHLETQRQPGANRRRAVSDLQTVLDQTQPLSTICAPDLLAAYRGDRFSNSPHVLTPMSLLQAPFRPGETRPPGTLRLVTTDPRVTENRNPLAVEFRKPGGVVGLVYDPLVRPSDGTWVPWLAQSWSVDPGGDGTTVTASLRDATWHDGRPVTADDVAFTYQLLSDTALGKMDTAVPAPLYREQSSLVNEATAVDESTVRLRLEPCNRTVAARALAVPVLPRDEWEPRAKPASIAGVSVDDAGTEALVWNNPHPVGSGPFAFTRASPRERLVLEAFDDHFVWDESPEPPTVTAGGPPFDTVDVLVASSSTAAVELLARGEADATVSALSPETVRRIGQNDDLRLSVTRSREFYHVGFDARQRPLGNPRFRRILARLVDREGIVRDVFDGYAEPVASLFAGTGWLDPEYRWSEDPLEFIGSDGEVNGEAAREAFREAGFSFDEGGRLRS